MAKRRKFTDQFRAKVALEVLRGDKTVQEIAAKHQVHADFCVEALNEAIAKHGPPEIMNTDQGSQFTGSA